MNIYPELFEDKFKFIFVHIPKTGGKSFRYILMNQFEKCNGFKLSNPERIEWISQQTPEDLLRFDLIHGHFPYYFLPPMPKRFKFFTILRDPIERIISQYNYWMNSKRKFDLSIQHIVREKKMTFEEYVNSDLEEVKYWLFAYMTHLSDPTCYKGNDVEVVERRIEQAVRALATDFDFVGITEKYDEGLEYLSKRYPGFKKEYKPQNVTPQWEKTAEVTDELRSWLKDYLKPEYLIYNMAKKIFESRINGSS